MREIERELIILIREFWGIIGNPESTTTDHRLYRHNSSYDVIRSHASSACPSASREAQLVYKNQKLILFVFLRSRTEDHT